MFERNINGQWHPVTGATFVMENVVYPVSNLSRWPEQDLINFGFRVAAPVEAPSESLPLADISRRQFYQQLKVDGIITASESLAAVKTGTIPAQLQAIIDQLEEEEKYQAEMLLSGAADFNRAHPLTETIGALQNWSSERIDQFWQAAQSL